MHFSTSILAAALLAPLNFVSAVCPSGWVGVGYHQLCQSSHSGCGANSGAVFANNCGIIALGDDDSYCSGGWNNGVVVHCIGSRASYVHTSGGDFGGYDGYQCTASTASCSGTNGLGSNYSPIYWCCPPE